MTDSRGLISEGLSNAASLDALFGRVQTWLERNPLPEEGRQTGRQFGLQEACVWILLRDHIGSIRVLPETERRQLADYLQSFQDAQRGFFTRSPDAVRSPAPDDTPPSDSSDQATTAIALQAMKALRATPSHRLQFLDVFAAAPAITTWLDSLDWTNASLAADDMTSALICLIHGAEVEGRGDAFRAYHLVLDRLAALQDAKTGLFAVSTSTFPWQSIIATDCLVRLHAYVRRPITRVARIVDSILSLDELDDALARTRGTAREALAAVNVLTLVSCQSSYRRADVHAMLRRTYTAITETQCDDGTFPANPSVTVEGRLFAGTPHEGGPSFTDTLCALWLRTATLTAIAVTLAERPVERSWWVFQDWPGLGYQTVGNPLTDHERVELPRWIRPSSHADIAPLEPAETPALSVVIPCFNLGLYLQEAVESVMAQTCRDFEVVIVDDGSTDEYTRLLLTDYQPPRTKIIRQDNNGLAAARNEGIRQSSGRYVCCLDPDDRLRPRFFELACSTLDRDQTVGLVSAHFETFDEADEAFRFESCDFPSLLVHNRAIEPAIFRREGWLRAGGYCTTFSSSGIEDWDLWITLIELGYRAEVIPETFWEYRIRQDQMSTGMYEPDTWGRLIQQLVARHVSSYREHLHAVIGQHASRWADLRRWSGEIRAAVGWWERNAGNWERLADHRDAVIQQQRMKIAELEQALQTRDDADKEKT